MDFVKSTIKNISISNENTLKRAKELMAHFGESENELNSVTGCSNILKFEGQLEEDYIKGNDVTLTVELYTVMKEYEPDSSTFNCRKEYQIHWIRNEQNRDGSYPQGNYDSCSGYSNYDRVEDSVNSASKQFEEFKEGKVERLDFFGIQVY